MTPLGWLEGRKERAVAPEEIATGRAGTIENPNQSPTIPEADPVFPRENPNKSPRVPEKSFLNLGGKNIFSETGEEEKENISGLGVELGVLGAPRGFTGILEGDGPPVGAETELPRPTRPFFTAGGALSIPFGSDPKYFWWQGGQSVKETIAELEAAQNQTQPAGPGDGPAG
jgi:hypothetical protein